MDSYGTPARGTRGIGLIAINRSRPTGTLDDSASFLPHAKLRDLLTERRRFFPFPAALIFLLLRNSELAGLAIIPARTDPGEWIARDAAFVAAPSSTFAGTQTMRAPGRLYKRPLFRPSLLHPFLQ